MSNAQDADGIAPEWIESLEQAARGEVVTFYSYKGGTGRTMALVNCAGLVARSLPPGAKPLLLIDFDLEAPGIHQYLASWPQFSVDFRASPGTLELFELIARRIDDALALLPEQARLDDERTAGLVAGIDLASFVTQVPGLPLHVICAGRAEEDYDLRLARMGWEGLFNKAPSLFRALGDRFAAEYSLTFVDSRTGLTDTSGICSMLLPDAIVVVFTPNHQSLTGIEHLMKRASRYRAESADLRPLRIYPLASRVDTTTEHFRTVWRMGGSAMPVFGVVRGYQPMFAEAFAEINGIPDSRQRALGAYFDKVQVPHSADYAFGERLCFVPGTSADTLSVRSSYEQFLPWLLTRSQPWEDPAAVKQETEVRSELESLDASIPAPDADWSPWTRRLVDFHVRMGRRTRLDFHELEPDLRVTLAFAMALASAVEGEFSKLWIERLADAWTDDDSPAISVSAVAGLLKTWSELGMRKLHLADEIRSWVVDWYKVFYPRLVTFVERRQWLSAALRLAQAARWDEFALALAEAAHELELGQGGESNADAFHAKSVLAKLLSDSGQEQRAAQLQSELVQQSERQFGDAASQTLESRRRLGATLRSLGHLEQARDLLSRVVQDCVTHLGAHHRVTLDTVNSLSSTLEKMGHVPGACALLEGNVAAYRQYFEPSDTDSLVSRSNLALMLLELGQHGRARELLEEVLATLRQFKPDDELAILLAMDALAGVCSAGGDTDRARVLLTELVAERTALLGASHQDTLAAKCDLAELMRTVGDTQQALALHQDVLQQREIFLGESHEDTVASLVCVATCLDQLAKYDEAVATYERAIPLLERVHGPLHRETLTAISNLALTLDELERSDEAVMMLRTVLAGRQESLGASDPDTIASMRDLGLVLTRTSQSEEGVATLQESLELALPALGTGHPTTAAISTDLAYSALELERPDLARAALVQVPRPDDRQWLTLMLDAATRLGDTEAATQHQARLLNLFRSERRPR